MFPSTPTRRFAVRWLLGSLAMVILTSLGSARAAEELDRKLRDSAEQILQELKKHNCKSVGVLPFGVQRPNEPTRYNQGLVNQNLADRLEVALLFAIDKNHPVDLLTKASNTAKSKLKPGVNHLTPQGREQLMGLEYPRAWRDGKREVALRPDVLLTGVAKISPYPKQTVVSVQAIFRDRPQQEPVEIEKITVDTDIRTMSESGGSYVATRGLFTMNKLGDFKLDAFHFGNEGGGVPPVAGGSAAPVRLTVYYDGVPVPYAAASLRDGIASIPEPGPSVKEVWFEIERTQYAGNRTYGVVLKVNGENTFFKQREEPLHCAKWLLTPEWTKTRIAGYQMDNMKIEHFRIMSDEESAAKGVEYGKDVGQISIVVFAAENEVGVKLPVPDVKLDDAAIREMEENAIGRAQVPTGEFPSLEEVQQSARGQADAAVNGDSSRGLIGSGAAGVNLVNFVDFRPFPTPVMIDCISYYKR